MFLNVVDDFAAPRLFEVDVDIRRFDAVFVQKAFEKEVELERANVRHIERVTDDRADAGTAGGAVDAALFRDANKVPNDKEVRRETEFGDDAEFAVETRHNLVRKLAVNQAFRIVGVTSLEPFDAKFAEVVVRRFIVRRNEDREEAFAEFQLEVATVGDFERTPNRVFEADGALHHFGAAFEVKLVGVHPHSVRIGAELPGVDAKNEVLRVGVLAANVVNVVRDNRRYAKLLRKTQRSLQRDLLLRDAVVLQLEIVAVAEKFAVPKRGVAGFSVGFGRAVPVGERARDLPGEAAAEANQAFAVLF